MEDLHRLLNDFDEYWDDSLNGKYRPNEIIQIAKALCNLKCTKEQLQSLSLTEQVTFQKAVLLLKVAQKK